MFSHVFVGTSDLDRAKAFYDKLLGSLGVGPAIVDGHRILYLTQTGVFGVSVPIDGQPCTFAADSPAQADAWHAAGVAAGGKSIEDPPGVREGAGGKLYLAYLRDPDGNKLCALHRM